MAKGESAAIALAEENLIKEGKTKYPLVDVKALLDAKNDKGVADVLSLLGEAHTQFMEKGEDAFEQILQATVDVGKHRGFAKGTKQDPFQPKQWEHPIRTGTYKTKNRKQPYISPAQQTRIANTKATTNTKGKELTKDHWIKRERDLYEKHLATLSQTALDKFSKVRQDLGTVVGVTEEVLKDVPEYTVYNSAEVYRKLTLAQAELFSEQVDAILEGRTWFDDLHSRSDMMYSERFGKLGEHPEFTQAHSLHKKAVSKLSKNITAQVGIPAEVVAFAIKKGGNVHGAYYPLETKITLKSRQNISHTAGTVFHELGHLFMGYAIPSAEEYINLRDKFLTNDFIKSLYGKGTNKFYREAIRVEEIIVDMYAAHKTGSWDKFARRYNIDESSIPSEFKTKKDNLLVRTYEALRNVIADLLGKEKLSNDDVKQFLDNLDMLDDIAIRTNNWDEFKTKLLDNFRATMSAKNYAEITDSDDPVKALTDFVFESEFKEQASEIKEEAKPYLDAGETLADLAINEEVKSQLGKTSLLRKFLDRLSKLLAGITAIVSVGAMTIPTDAMAQQGFAQYTQGQQISGVSQDASNTINWVVDNKDHKGKSFVVADKAKGVIHVVSPDGKVLNTQNALFGKGKGNSAVTGNTPSGRFALKKTDTKTLTKADQKAFGDSVLDLTDPHTGRAITAEDGLIFAMHRVINTPQRHKALNTATANDNYISNGCINIPTAFYDTAVDGLDGAMVYILDMPQTAKKASTRSQTKSVSNSSPTSDWSKPTMAKWSVKPATNVNELNPSLNNDKLQRVLEKSLGEFADKVTLISADEFENHKGFEKLKSNGIEGFYDPNTKQVAIVVDNIQEQDGLSANDRLAWVAWHELYHKGLDVKYGQDLDRVVSDMGTNPFIDNLAEAIMADRAMNSLASIDKNTAIQEALVELGAALQTKNLGGLKDRYGVNVPMALRDDVLGTLGKFLDRIKSLVGKVIGKPTVTAKQVEALLEDSIAYAKVGKADKEMVKSILDDFQEPTSAVSQSALFSANGISGKAQALWEKVFPRDLYYLFTGNDVGRVGTTPDRDTTKSMKAKRTKMNVRSRFHTLMNDSQQIIIDLDPQGDGGELSRSVANFSNKKNQLTRKWERKLKGLEMQFIEFAQKNKDIFKSRFDRKQVDDTVQSVTTALHAITEGNEAVRKNIEETIFGKDITLADGTVIHIDGLLDKVNQHKQYIANAQFNGIQVPSYTTKQFERYQTQLNEMIAIQNKFDQDNYNILGNTNSQNKNRENWRGYDGLTFAEAEQKLKDFHKQGLLDNDVTDGLVKREYEVKKYIEVNGLPQVVKVKHYSYEVADVEKKAKGRIMPLVDAYVNLSHEMHQFTVDQIGEKRAGGKTSGKWEVSTMGKVEQIYSEQAKDSSGNPIDRLYDATVATSIDNIISMKHAAQYTGRRMGRATQGGTAMEQLAWRLSLTAQQAASKDIAIAMDKLHGSRPDLVKRYSQNDNEYAMVNGIVHEIPVLDKNGNPVLDVNGDPKTKLVKLSFADQEANAALFGDNLPSQDDSDAWFFFRAVAHLVKAWTKFNSMSLTQTAGFAVNNAYKGFNEKLNQMMAWDSDHAFVKTIIDPGKQDLFDGTGTKLHAMAQLNKIDVRGLPRLAAREKAALMFAQDLANNNLADFVKTALNKLPSLGAEKMVQEEYAKLVEMYERGGISSRVEELMRQTQSKKLRYGFGKTLPKVVDGFYAMLETATTLTMAQELVSSLVMVDFLTNQVGMDRDVAIDANLHFMNFNKRGTSQMMNYLRKYTMFANAIAQGSRAFERSFFIQTNDENDSVFGIKGVKWSKPALWRTARNVGMSIAMHSFARLVAANICPDKDGLGNQVGNLNEYQLLREIPISTGCNEYFRYPVEYGVGMVENAMGVGIVQVSLGNWSVEQAGNFIIDAFKDNASPIGLAMGDSDSPFGKVAFLLYPFVPDPLKELSLAFGGVDQFGNKLNANFVNEKYRPGSGKKTTDSAWHKMAEDLYGSGMFGNLTPEEVRVLVTGGFRGVARDILTWSIENDPKKSVWKSLVGAGSVYREEKEMDTVAYTMVQNRLEKRYRDLVLYYNEAKGRDKVLPSKSWLSKNGYELDADDHKALELISQYFERMKNKRLDQETRFKYNVELLKGLKKIEGSE